MPPHRQLAMRRTSLLRHARSTQRSARITDPITRQPGAGPPLISRSQSVNQSHSVLVSPVKPVSQLEDGGAQTKWMTPQMFVTAGSKYKYSTSTPLNSQLTARASGKFQCRKVNGSMILWCLSSSWMISTKNTETRTKTSPSTVEQFDANPKLVIIILPHRRVSTPLFHNLI
jgi:hypothetical protein